MSGKIFYRQRTKMKDGAHQPRYILVAVADLNLKVYGQHLRLQKKLALHKNGTANAVPFFVGSQSKNAEI